ncbi:partial [Paramuricea clavata]|uniref:Partial n=1 Tax=Paramuricea clavata TaxID=317549 RepID=A0A7D9L187_PARCT|nr:partial [Paramuricea clavata]
MFARRKSKVDWKLVDGAFTKQRRLHLVKDRDGLDRCPVTGCEHPGFASQRGCRKHVKIKHGWYYYFDEKPNVSMDLFDTSPSAANGTNEKASRTVPGCSTDNEFARSFSQWLQSSCGGGKSPKQSDISVTRALKFVKFCCDESGDAEEDVLTSPNLIDYALGSPKLLTKFVDSLKEKWGLGQSGQISYVTSISDLLDFRKFNRPPASVLQNFAVTEVYVKRARKCLGKSMRSNWTTELDIETLESRRSWATLSEVQSVIPFHVERYESVLEKCMACSSSVKTGDVTFATRFVAAYMFLKVKGCRPMTYQHLTLRMFESAKRNEGMVDQTIFKTAKKYGFDSVYFDECSMEILGKYITYIRPLFTPTCEYVLVNRNGKQFQKLTDLFSVLVFEAIGKYIHPTRYRQIIETESSQVLLPNEQKWISEDQKHSSNVARVHYQKKRSREVAIRGRLCMQKLVDKSKNLETESESVEQSSPGQEDLCKDTPTTSSHELTKRRSGIRFTHEEDNYIRLGVEQFGLRWSMILRHPEFNFNGCRVPNTLRKRAEVLKLV